MFILALLSSGVFHLQNCISDIFFNLLCLGDKKILSEFLRNEVDIREIMNVSPNILAKNLNFKKLRHGFVDEKTLITTTLISSCHWKTLVPLLAKEKT